MRYLDDDLVMCAVTAVTTSRIARKQGFAQKLTALQLAAAALEGAEVAVLGIFDQGFYDKLGFGTGSYEHTIKFDPATLLVQREFRVPTRLDKGDWRDIHAALTSRLRGHGGCNLDPPGIIKAELGFSENGFGLGYYRGDELTHFFWGDAKGEHGPYEISYLAYRDVDQLLELLALIKSLADQVSSVSLNEPQDLQLEALLHQPFRNRRNTKNSAHDNGHRAAAWWQLRILDLAACLSRHGSRGDPFSFNLSLADPIAAHLPESQWQGVGGDYVITIDTNSSAESGSDAALPTLSASVNAFSRLFFGVVSASGLSFTDPFAADESLLRQLDLAFCLPTPRLSWSF
jgi:predicted acetyltransferase